MGAANCAQRQKRQRLITAVGAAIGNVITSVTATSASAGVNVLDHLNAVQRNQAAVKENPHQWLPWNYPQTEAAYHRRDVLFALGRRKLTNER